MAARQPRVWGGEGNMWSDNFPQDQIDKKIFPRFLATGESAWRARELHSTTYEYLHTTKFVF